jgi:carboxylesterase type B
MCAPTAGAPAERVATTSGVVPYTPSATDLAVSAIVQGYWSRFAKTGDPAGAPAWTTWTSADDTLQIAPTPSIVDGVRTANCDFWAQYE